MKRTLLTLALTATLLTACGSDPSTSDRPASAGGPIEPATDTTVTVATIAPATTNTAAAPVTTRAAAPPATVPPTTTGNFPSPAPVGWKTCTSARGYSIEYPGSWHTDTPARTECRYFDPAPVEYTPNSDGFMFAMMLGTDNRPFEEALRPLTGADSRTLIHEETTVGGRRAVRYEVELISGGRGLLPDHSRLYGYLVEREGIAFGVTTYWIPDQPMAQYRVWKDTVDRAVTTLRFL
jgi:hypothetical protein